MGSRKHRPKWHIIVDSVIFRYVDDPRTIRLQQNRIREIELSGAKITADYRLRESAGGEAIPKQERYVLELEQAREQITICKERMRLMNRVLHSCFDDEERKFIDLFWLSVPIPDRGAVWTRNLMVVHEIPWLRDPDKKTIPGQGYYRLRGKIYSTFWEVLFPDREKEQGEADYIEHINLSEER